MNLLCYNDNEFVNVEVPDLRIYHIYELKKCTSPPLFILYDNQLFGLSYSTDNDWFYVSPYDYSLYMEQKKSNDEYSTLTYDPSTNTFNVTTPTINQKRGGQLSR